MVLPYGGDDHVDRASHPSISCGHRPPRISSALHYEADTAGRAHEFGGSRTDMHACSPALAVDGTTRVGEGVISATPDQGEEASRAAGVVSGQATQNAGDTRGTAPANSPSPFSLPSLLRAASGRMAFEPHGDIVHHPKEFSFPRASLAPKIFLLVGVRGACSSQASGALLQLAYVAVG